MFGNMKPHVWGWARNYVRGTRPREQNITTMTYRSPLIWSWQIKVNHSRSARSLLHSAPTTIGLERPQHLFTTSSFSSPTRLCWKCGADTSPERELFFCGCGVVQKPPSEFTYFQLLQIKPSFDIDIVKLSRRFKDTQRLLHPDKFSIKPKEEQLLAEEQSSLLNNSYYTLLKPLTRAIYMLELHDVTISENDSVSDHEFLMNIMEDFEIIHDASNTEDVECLDKRNNTRIEQCMEELSTAFSHSNYATAKHLTIQLRYFTTIQDRIKEMRIKSFDQ